VGLQEQERPRDKVLIIAHSMGGLDARYMISRLGMEEHVAALLTVCTPHRGSPYADWCLLNLGKRMGGLWLTNLFGLDVRALSDLTTQSCSRFNEEITDSPRGALFLDRCITPMASRPAICDPRSPRHHRHGRGRTIAWFPCPAPNGAGILASGRSTIFTASTTGWCWNWSIRPATSRRTNLAALDHVPAADRSGVKA